MREPARPWVVRAASGFGTSHRSMAPAFEQVKAVHASGLPAYVYRWHDGGWVLDECLRDAARPVTAAGSAVAVLARRLTRCGHPLPA